MSKNANFEPVQTTVQDPALALDDWLLDDAALRVLAHLRDHEPAASAGGSGWLTLFRAVPERADEATTAAIGRAAVAQAVIGLLGVSAQLSDLVLHVGWQPGVTATAHDSSAALAAVLEYCAALGVGRGVGESMSAAAEAPGCGWRVVAEVEDAGVPDVHGTPIALDGDTVESRLLLIAPGERRDGLQGGVLARVFDQGGAVDARGGADAPDADAVEALAGALRQLAADGRMLACGSRGAGGLLALAAHMALAGQVGVALNVDLLTIDGDGVSDGRMDSGEVKNWTEQISGRRAELTLRALFSEAPAALVQIRADDVRPVMDVLRAHGLGASANFIGKTRPAHAATDQGKGALTVWRDATQVFGATLAELAQPDPGARAAQRKGAEPESAPLREKTHEEKIKAMRLGL